MTRRTFFTVFVAALIGTGVIAVSAQKVNKKYGGAAARLLNRN